VIALIFEIVDKLYNIRVLAHFKDIDFSALLVNLNDFHILLPGCLDSHAFTLQQVCTLKHLTELTLADGWSIEGKVILNLG
jgi:hypothetical protein